MWEVGEEAWSDLRREYKTQREHSEIPSSTRGALQGGEKGCSTTEHGDAQIWEDEVKWYLWKLDQEREGGLGGKKGEKILCGSC